MTQYTREEVLEFVDFMDRNVNPTENTVSELLRQMAEEMNANEHLSALFDTQLAVNEELELENEILKERAKEALSIITDSKYYLNALYELVPILKRYLIASALDILGGVPEDTTEMDMSLKELFDFANRNIELFETEE